MRICLSLSRVHSRCAGKGCPHQSECWLRNRWVLPELADFLRQEQTARRGAARRQIWLSSHGRYHVIKVEQRSERQLGDSRLHRQTKPLFGQEQPLRRRLSGG